MQRADYLASADVQAFIAWLRPRLCTHGAFVHRWSSPGGGDWSCSSLYEAYLGYRWPERRKHQSFAENERALDGLSGGLRSAFAAGDAPGIRAGALGVLEWGGVRGSIERLDEFCAQLTHSCALLDPRAADLDRLDGVLMNSSFTKVYHLLLDDFPIYDGRVGAATAYLVRRFLEARRSRSIPEALRFGWVPARARADGGPHREPGSALLRFPRLGVDQLLHARCNVKAARLFGELATFDCFGALPPARRVRAIEAALFMVGYDLPQSRA